MEDGNHIWREFETIEHLFRPGSILVVDDVLWATKGDVLKPYLIKSKDWTVDIHNVENGMLVAYRQ